MRKFLLLFLTFFIFLTCCQQDDSILTDSDNSLAKGEFSLFPQVNSQLAGLGLKHIETNNGNTVFFYRDNRQDQFSFSMSLIDNLGTILWTKKQTTDERFLLYHSGFVPFFSNNKIILIATGLPSSNTYWYEYDLDGELLSKKIILNNESYNFTKEGDFIFGHVSERTYPGTNIYTIKLSLDGEVLETNNFFTPITISYGLDISIKNNKIYLFHVNYGDINNPDDNSYNYSIFSSTGVFIKTITTELPHNYANERGFPLENGNVIMSFTRVFEGTNSSKTHDFLFIMYDSQGNKINELTLENQGPGGQPFLRELFNSKVSVLFKKHQPFTFRTKSLKLLVLDSNLNEIYQRDIGSFNGKESYASFVEYSNSYHMFGYTTGTDGDFNLPITSLGNSALFYLKLNK